MNSIVPEFLHVYFCNRLCSNKDTWLDIKSLVYTFIPWVSRKRCYTVTSLWLLPFGNLMPPLLSVLCKRLSVFCLEDPKIFFLTSFWSFTRLYFGVYYSEFFQVYSRLLPELMYLVLPPAHHNIQIHICFCFGNTL